MHTVEKELYMKKMESYFLELKIVGWEHSEIFAIRNNEDNKRKTKAVATSTKQNNRTKQNIKL